MANDLEFVRSVSSSLQSAGIDVLIFGGWAEELHGVTPPRAHRDIDLLALKPDDAALEGFLRSRNEIRQKRL